MDFLTDRAIYERVIQREIPAAERFVWMATSDLKDLYVDKGRRMIPFLQVLAVLARKGVSLRLLYAKDPGPAFQRDFDRYPELLEGLERMLCPRIHFKSVIVDGRFAWFGSANLTGAGMGAKSEHRRNFECGMASEDPLLIEQVMGQFDGVWIGRHCAKCGRKKFCTDFRELI